MQVNMAQFRTNIQPSLASLETNLKKRVEEIKQFKNKDFQKNKFENFGPDLQQVREFIDKKLTGRKKRNGDNSDNIWSIPATILTHVAKQIDHQVENLYIEIQNPIFEEKKEAKLDNQQIAEFQEQDESDLLQTILLQAKKYGDKFVDPKKLENEQIAKEKNQIQVIDPNQNKLKKIFDRCAGGLFGQSECMLINNFHVDSSLQISMLGDSLTNYRNNSMYPFIQRPKKQIQSIVQNICKEKNYFIYGQQFIIPPFYQFLDEVEKGVKEQLRKIKGQRKIYFQNTKEIYYLNSLQGLCENYKEIFLKNDLQSLQKQIYDDIKKEEILNIEIVESESETENNDSIELEDPILYSDQENICQDYESLKSSFQDQISFSQNNRQLQTQGKVVINKKGKQVASSDEQNVSFLQNIKKEDSSQFSSQIGKINKFKSFTQIDQQNSENEESSDGNCLKLIEKPKKKEIIKKEKKAQVNVKVQCNQCYKLLRKDRLRVHLSKVHQIKVPLGRGELDQYIDNFQKLQTKGEEHFKKQNSDINSQIPNKIQKTLGNDVKDELNSIQNYESQIGFEDQQENEYDLNEEFNIPPIQTQNVQNERPRHSKKKRIQKEQNKFQMKKPLNMHETKNVLIEMIHNQQDQKQRGKKSKVEILKIFKETKNELENRYEVYNSECSVGLMFISLLHLVNDNQKKFLFNDNQSLIINNKL